MLLNFSSKNNWAGSLLLNFRLIFMIEIETQRNCVEKCFVAFCQPRKLEWNKHVRRADKLASSTTLPIQESYDNLNTHELAVIYWFPVTM